MNDSTLTLAAVLACCGIALGLVAYVDWMSTRNGILLEVMECMGPDRSQESFNACSDIVRSRYE
jgi:hypothetical protein